MILKDSILKRMAAHVSLRYMCSHVLWMNWMVVVSDHLFCNRPAHPDDPDHLQNKIILHNLASFSVWMLRIIDET